jgi:hypothetical protein
MHAVLVVLSDPVEGRADEYNGWYSDVHIRDALRYSETSISAQRFRRVPAPAAGPERHLNGYLAIYETGDPAEFTAGHGIVFTPAMPVSSAYSYDHIDEAYYDPIAWRTRTPGTPATGGVILERLHARACDARLVDWYADERLPKAMAAIGAQSALFARGAAHQMYRVAPEAACVAIYRTTDLARSLAQWREVDRACPPAWGPQDAILDAFEPIIPRLTRQEVLHADPAAQERERRAREALGDRVHRGPPGA